MSENQLDFGLSAEVDTALSAPPLFTPPRLRLHIEVLERHDDPDALVLTVKGTDGDGQLLALVSKLCVNGAEWGDALGHACTFARWAWYEMHSPFDH